MSIPGSRADPGAWPPPPYLAAPLGPETPQSGSWIFSQHPAVLSGHFRPLQPSWRNSLPSNTHTPCGSSNRKPRYSCSRPITLSSSQRPSLRKRCILRRRRRLRKVFGFDALPIAPAEPGDNARFAPAIACAQRPAQSKHEISERPGTLPPKPPHPSLCPTSEAFANLPMILPINLL